MIDISLVCPEQYVIEDLIDPELMLEKFTTVEADGHLSVEEFAINKQENVRKIFEFIFEGNHDFIKTYSDSALSVYDLSLIKDEVISFDKLEVRYNDWLKLSNHDNTMDEYGKLVGAIGFIRRNNHKSNLLALARKRT